jgi:hypothetical protein
MLYNHQHWRKIEDEWFNVCKRIYKTN